MNLTNNNKLLSFFNMVTSALMSVLSSPLLYLVFDEEIARESLKAKKRNSGHHFCTSVTQYKSGAFAPKQNELKQPNNKA